MSCPRNGVIGALILVASISNCIADQPEIFSDYLDDAEESPELLYEDMTDDGSEVLDALLNQNLSASLTQSKKLAGNRKLDPFLLHVEISSGTDSGKILERKKKHLADWFLLLEESGNGSWDNPYQVVSLRMARLWLQRSGAKIHKFIIFPKWMNYTAEDITRVDNILAWFWITDPMTGELRWVSFEMGSAFSQIFTESGALYTGPAMATLIKRCIAENLLPCQEGIARARQSRDFHGAAMIDFFDISDRSAYSLQQLGDNFAGFRFMNRDLDRAEHYWHASAERGDPSAMSRLGRLYAGDYSNNNEKYNPNLAREYLEKAYAAGNRHAARHLVNLAKNDKSITYSDEKIRDLLKASATSEDEPMAEAMLQYADYLLGSAKESDRIDACKWVRKAEKKDPQVSGSFALHRHCERTQGG